MDLKHGIAGLLLVGAVAGCNQQSQGFVLPPGDAAQGEATFVELGCNLCHRIDGVIDRNSSKTDSGIDVRLGGQVTRVKTYGDLVTSIINPSHRLSRGHNSMTVREDGSSRMPIYNQVMTVQQLIDLTAFLQGTYSVYVPEYTMYAYP